ncbi:MAG: YitT family protein [Clostridia bacterium]|nr:YitT family protein [Clostridia bacterium]
MDEQHNNQAEQISILPPKITKENINPIDSKKSKLLQWIQAIVYVCISSFLIAFAAYCLITPNEFTIGGASGIAILVNVATKGAISQGLLLFCINLPLVVLSFFFVKKKFAILSAMNIALQSLWLILLELVLPDFCIVFEENGEKIFAAIAAGLAIGVAVALAFKAGGSTGGADIVAVMIQKKFKATSIAWVIFFLNCVIIVCSIFVFRADTPAATLLPIMMSAFESYIESKANEAITNGFHSAVEFRIITTKPEEMSTALMHELSRGVTALPAKGMYTKEDRTMLFCVVSRRQIATLQRIMKSIDPDSFAVKSNVSQVLGLGFHSGEL